MTLAVVHVGGEPLGDPDSATSDSWTSTSGSLIVVVSLAVFATSYGVITSNDVTDSYGNTYSPVTAGLFNGDVGIAMYYNDNGGRGAAHTVTTNLVNDSGDGYVTVAVLEITGQSALPLDPATFAFANDNTSPFTVTSAAAIVGNQIAVYGVVTSIDVDSPWTAPAGYTKIIEYTDGTFSACWLAAYKINEVGTPSPGATNAGHVLSVCHEVFATFKEAVATYTPASIVVAR